ncbi:MAG: PAS domain S-box protein [bacterium]|nr:PAS domain S-box protein [bacterium]
MSSLIAQIAANWYFAPLPTVVLLALLLPRFNRPGAKPLAVFVVATGVWLTGEVVDYGITDFAWKVFWMRVRYGGIVILPVAWFVMVCQITQRSHWVRTRNVLLLCVMPMVTFSLVLTGMRHTLLWREVALDAAADYPRLAIKVGVAYWIHTAYSYALVVGGAALVYAASRQTGRRYRNQMRLVLYAFAFPFVGNIFFQIGVGPAGRHDFTPFMLVVTCAIFTWNCVRRGFLNPPVRPARDVVVQSMQDAVLVIDADGTVLDMNPAAQSMFDVNSGELEGQPLTDCLDLPDLCLTEDASPLAMETSRLDASGTLCRYEARVSPVHQRLVGHAGFVIVLRDVTRQREAAEEHLRLFTAITQVDELVIAADTEGRITYVNPAFEHATGYGRDEVLGRELEVLTDPAGASSFYDLALLDAEGSGTPRGRFVNRRKDGSAFDVEGAIYPIHDEDGRHVGCLSVQRDITEDVRLEGQLRQAQKMETVGQLAGGVAHDFNNLLQAINGFTGMALRELDEEHRAYPMLQEVAEAGDRAGRLVGQLLAFSRRQLIRPENLDLNEVVTGLLKMLGRVLGEHIRISFVPGRLRGMALVDQGQIEQVIMNLCVNARDAMPAGGTLTVETFSVEIDEAYCVKHSWAKPGQTVGFSVSDTGSGMNRETQERIFDPFFTTKEQGKGTGLGLSTVYGIVKQHGGMIDVYSEEGRGTVFKVYFPMVDEAEADEAMESAEEPPGGTETILLAEDEAMVRDLAHRMLAGAGYTVLDAEDGEDALRVARAHGDEISLALLDVVMPALGGREVSERLSELYPHIRFLFSSGYSASTLHRDFVLDEDVELIPKPYDHPQLLRQIRQVLDGE